MCGKLHKLSNSEQLAHETIARPDSARKTAPWGGAVGVECGAVWDPAAEMEVGRLMGSGQRSHEWGVGRV